MSRRSLEALVALAGPVLLVVAVTAVGSQLNPVRQLEFGEALVSVAIVVAIYVFVGNSGVLSFGHISFVAVGAYLSGILTLDVRAEEPDPADDVRGPAPHAHRRRRSRSCSPRPPGALFALVAGVPLMRLWVSPPASRRSRCSDHHQHHQLLGQVRARSDGALAACRRTASGR